MKLRIGVLAVVFAVLGAAGSAHGVVVGFDDLDYEFFLTGSGYVGLTWEIGNSGYRGNQGEWVIPPSAGSYFYSGPHNAVNAWGCTLLGIGFPTEVDVSGAYFAAQGDNPSGWTTGVRVHGYLEGSEVAVTDWFTDIDQQPDWFSMNLNNVDRIVIESVPVLEGGGWYGMDDLTFVPEPTALSLLALGGLAMLRRKRSQVSANLRPRR